jgi:hypothetical protein
VKIDGYYVPNICGYSIWSNGRFIALGPEQMVRWPSWRKIEKNIESRFWWARTPLIIGAFFAKLMNVGSPPSQMHPDK